MPQKKKVTKRTSPKRKKQTRPVRPSVSAKRNKKNATTVDLSIEQLSVAVQTGDRNALARAITLIESSALGDAARQAELIERLSPKQPRSIRIGISGIPGAGKSTLIDKLGLLICQAGHRVAVIAVDPSSPVSGGSILGDKTRMEELSRHQNAFIRPSPSRGVSGGVASRTREVITLCEAAGFDVVLVETVGVGQGEVHVHSMVDCMLLVTLTGGGDDLQSMKRGVLELSDIVLVNKTDGENTQQAQFLALELGHSLSLFHHRASDRQIKVLPVSGLLGEGISAVWDEIEVLVESRKKSGAFQARRQQQALHWYDEALKQGLWVQVVHSKQHLSSYQRHLETVKKGQLDPFVAAYRVIEKVGL